MITISRPRFAVFLLLAILMGAPLPTAAQDGFFWMRCSAWSEFDSADHQLYISGLKDGLLFAEQKIQEVKIPTISTDATIRAIDVLCEDPGNILIPVPFVLTTVPLKLYLYAVSLCT